MSKKQNKRTGFLLLGIFTCALLLKQPIALRPEHIASAPTKLRVKHANRTGVDYRVTTVAPEAGSSSESSEPPVLFTVDGEFTSWSQRRVFRDATGLPLFNLRRKSSGVTFFIEIPGDEEHPLATLAPRWSALKDKCDIFFSNAAAGGEEVVLEVRGQDVWKRWTHVYSNGALVMRTKLAGMMAVYVPGKRIAWEAEVAEGMDLSLASAITVFLAENLYNSSYPSSYSSNTETGGCCPYSGYFRFMQL